MSDYPSIDTAPGDRSPDRTAGTRSGAPPGTLGLGLLVLRLFVGLAMAAHGAQKLFGVFGGSGIEGTGQFFESVGFEPGTPLAVLSGVVELGGGLLLALGVATSLAGAAIVANMTGAYAVTQSGASADFFTAAGGPELELFFIVTAFALILTGPGRLALRIPVLDGPKLRAFGVVLAIAGAVGAVLVQNA